MTDTQHQPEMAVAQVDARENEIPRVTGNLRSQVDTLHTVIDDLEEQLQDVMRSEPEGDTPGEPMEECHSSLGINIRSSCDSIRNATQRLRFIIDRLQL